MGPRYRERFLRSIGIMDEKNLEMIQSMTVAVGGLGLGGSIFINLVRMGFEKFHIADPDVYERTNINRQRMAKETTVGVRKDEALLSEARSINPDIQVRVFRDGVISQNIDEFLDGVDWVIDTVDVFAINEKLLLNSEATKRGIPVVSCGAIGFGATVVVFDQTTPSFGALSGISPNQPAAENVQRFARFICPRVPDYMAEQVDKALKGQSYIPFVVPGVEFAAAMAVTEIAKQILDLGERVRAPYGIYIDPVQLRFEKYSVVYDQKNDEQDEQPRGKLRIAA